MLCRLDQRAVVHVIRICLETQTDQSGEMVTYYLRPTKHPEERGMDKAVEMLVSRQNTMTLEES